MLRYVQDASARVAEVSFDDLYKGADSFYGSYELNGNYEYGAESDINVVVDMEIDGKRFARATGKANRDEINRLNRIDERRSGKV